MATNHDVWDAVAQTDGAPGNSFEFLLAIQANRTGAYIQTGDITNVAPAFAPKSRARQTYAAKGVDLSVTYARNLTLTFDVEVVRDANGAFQPLLQDLINAQKVFGQANRRRIQAYDALGADYAFQSEFAIEAVRANTGWDDASFFTVTATQYTPATWITNPVLAGNVPLIGAVSPTPAAIAAGTHVYIQGSGFKPGGVGITGASAVQSPDGTNVTSYTVISDTLIDAVLPVATAGPSSVKVTNPTGASQVYTGLARA